MDNNKTFDTKNIEREKTCNMKSKLILLKNGKKVFEIKLKPTRDSAMGEVDIILNPAKKMSFENVVVGNEMKVLDKSRRVTSISWHGYFKEESERILYPPIIHIKSKDKIIYKINSFASIDSVEPVPLPVCSLYIPKRFNLNAKGKVRKQDGNYYLDIGHIKEDIRCDFFVFPKNISYKMFETAPSYTMFILADLGIYNDTDRGFNIINDFEKYLFENVYGHDVFVRVVINPANITIYRDTKSQIYQDYSNRYTLILNDVNDVYNKIFDRLIVSFNEGGEAQVYKLKNVYEEKLGIKKNNDKFWDSLRENYD